MTPKALWLLPAALSLAFLAYSLPIVVAHGPFGYIDAPLASGLFSWPMQVALDVVIAALTGAILALRLGRRHGIRPLPWILFTLAMGSIGLLALVARVLYAEAKAARADESGRGAPPVPR